MNQRIWFSTLAMSVFFLTAHAQTCGLRDNGATMTDPVTGIEFQKCPVGQTWAGRECTGSGKRLLWGEAMQQYGQGHWRLITKDEAEQVGRRARECAYAATWTSSPIAGKTGFAWYFDFGNGVVYDWYEKNRLNVLLVRAKSGNADTSEKNSSPRLFTTSNLDTLERWQAAQANQQQADRVFAGKRRSNDENANTDQPAPGPTEGMATNRGRVRVNMAYCIDSDKRPYGGSLKCSAQRFGVASVDPEASVQVLLPNSGLQAFIFACTHPAKPYDVTYANNGLTGRCAAF